MWWNFVGRSHEEILDDRADWEAGRGSAPSRATPASRCPPRSRPSPGCGRGLSGRSRPADEVVRRSQPLGRARRLGRVSVQTAAVQTVVDRGGLRLDEQAYAAFDNFARARTAALLRFAYLLCGDRDRAADLVQDALERAAMAWPRIINRDDPEAYVRRIIVNRNVSIWRRTRRERLVAETPEVAYESPDPHDARLWAELAKLPARQRAVLVLRFYEDLGVDETAARSAARSAPSRARRRAGWPGCANSSPLTRAKGHGPDDAIGPHDGGDPMNDDDLEADLRRVLADPRHRLPDSLVPLEGVHAGARRRKARRQAFAAVAGATAGVLGVVAFVAINHLARSGGTALAGCHGRSPVRRAQPAPTLSARANRPCHPARARPEPAVSSRPGAVPADFTPRVGDRDRAATPGGCSAGAARSCPTVDGGKTFSYVSGPATSGLPDERDRAPLRRRPHGWAVSPARQLQRHVAVATTDGGAHWNGVPLTGSSGPSSSAAARRTRWSRKGADTGRCSRRRPTGRRLGVLGSSGPLTASHCSPSSAAGRSSPPRRRRDDPHLGVRPERRHARSNQPCAPASAPPTSRRRPAASGSPAPRAWATACGRSDDGATWAASRVAAAAPPGCVVGAIDGTPRPSASRTGRSTSCRSPGGTTKAKGPSRRPTSGPTSPSPTPGAGFAIDDIRPDVAYEQRRNVLDTDHLPLSRFVEVPVRAG